MYRYIAEQSVACQRYVYQLGEPDRKKGFLELEKKFSDFYVFFETSRIYLPEHICILVDKLFAALRTPVVGAFVYSGIDSYAPSHVQEGSEETLMTAVKAFEAEIPAAKKALEDEFRKLLGVETSPP